MRRSGTQVFIADDKSLYRVLTSTKANQKRKVARSPAFDNYHSQERSGRAFSHGMRYPNSMKTSLTLVSLFFSIPISALGLCSEPSTPCQWYAVHHGQPTFVGMAVSEETVSDVLRIGEQTVPVTVQKVTFRVEEPFESTPTKAVDVYGSGTTNDLRFKVGVRYLVYGFRGKDGKIRTGKCTRTAPVSDAAEDLSFLRSLPTLVGGGIRGLVRFVSPGTQTGTVAGTITESGSDGDHRTQVAASGWYEVHGLPPGDYRETFTPDDNSTDFVSLKLSIPVNGSCAESGVRLGNVTVSGRVFDEAGAPLSAADVFLFYALDGHFHPDVALTTRTDADGRFTFHRVEAAKFIMSSQLAGSEMTFFPGTHDVSKTEIIEVYDGKPLSGLAVRFPRSPSRSQP